MTKTIRNLLGADRRQAQSGPGRKLLPRDPTRRARRSRNARQGRSHFPLGLGLLLVGLAAAGCKSSSLSRYVSPRITGRVVDLETRRPIQHVKVQRINSDKSSRPVDVPKGSQVLTQAPPVATGKDGRFTLGSVRSLTPFGRTGWYAVSVSFEHCSYRRSFASYTLANATNTPKGEPAVDAGDILLTPRVK